MMMKLFICLAICLVLLLCSIVGIYIGLSITDSSESEISEVMGTLISVKVQMVSYAGIK